MKTRSFSLFLALRYLKPKRTFVSIITLISVLGVAIAIMLLIVVISVMTGFERELQRKVLGFEPHITVVKYDNEPMGDWPLLAKKYSTVKDIEAIAPYVQGPVVAQFEHTRMTPVIRAIDPELERKVIDMKPFIKEGNYDLDGNKTILGIDFARKIGARVGDTISVYALDIEAITAELDRIEREGGKADATLLRQMVLPIDLEVTGLFESGRYQYDSQFLIVPLHIGQEIYNLGGAVHGLAMKTSHPMQAEAIKQNLLPALEEDSTARTWIDANEQIFSAIRTERSMMFLILTMAIIVAGFCIMNTQITTTVQKTREIGIMKALGARTVQIVGVFLSQGLVIAVFGTVSGLLLGMGVVHFRNDIRAILASFGNDPFPSSIYEFSQIPAEIVPHDVAIICLSAFVICTVAALIPAWAAARLDPVKALRSE